MKFKKYVKQLSVGTLMSISFLMLSQVHAQDYSSYEDCIAHCNDGTTCVQTCKPYLDKSTSHAYPGLTSFVRTSKLSSVEQRQLILDNMPIWIMASDEDYFPKAFQEYKKHDVKSMNITLKQDKENVNLKAYDDIRHQAKGGKYNTVKLADNLITAPIHFHDKDKPNRTASSMDPQAAPTYAFYLETNSGESWIRYFLFFGYNSVPKVGKLYGNHFADWIHIAVKLKQEGTQYIPAQYYFSAHNGGKTWNSDDTSLDYYISTGPQAYKEVEFDGAKAAKQYHVRVFAANGTHESYATRGWHKTPAKIRWDYTDFGSYVIDPNVRENNPNAKTNSTLHYSSVYAWDMGTAVVMEKDGMQTGKYLKNNVKPADLFGGINAWKDIWFAANEGNGIAIMSSGQKVSAAESGYTADAPSGKIIGWGNNFNE